MHMPPVAKLIFQTERLMAKGFTLEVNPWVYISRYSDPSEGKEKWTEQYIVKPHLSPGEEEKLDPDRREEILKKRNTFEELPLVNYTTQYGFGCFEGLKAFPQKDGSLKVFRPDENAKRLARSMKGILMPPFPPEMFVQAVLEVTARNRDLGFTPKYDPAWEKDNFFSGHSVYIRPFTYSEPGIGLNLSHDPWVVIVTTTVGAYFQPGNSKAVITDKVRANPGGTGWIKCSANYVTAILVKKAAIADGYMEAFFLDAKTQTYFEEGSSCNVFFLLKNGTLVTPELGDTVLPGITRMSILELAGSMGALTHTLLMTLKGIQYGGIEDRFGWLFICPE
jgi:branched-chain amino acid aminotransferase